MEKNQNKFEPQFLTNLIINSGDTLESISVLKARVTRQDLYVGISAYSFRKHLLANSLAHSFYKGFLWMIPISDKKVEDLNLEQVMANYFTKQLEIEAEEILDFSDDFLWTQVGLVLFRDALRYILFNKFENNGNMIVRKLRVYDKKRIVQSDMTVSTVLGVYLGRIFKVDTNNVGISPLVTYDAYSFNSRVEDRFERQRYITKSSRCSFVDYDKRLNDILSKVLPLTVNFSNKILDFKLPFYEITEKKKRVKRGLEEWF